MNLLQEMGYAAYGVRDLDRAVDFFRDACQLEVSERDGGTVYLTGDTRHHWVRLERSEEPGMIRLGYRAAGAAAIQEIARRLDAAGIAWTPGADPGRVAGGLRFRAPDGVNYEIYEKMLTLPSSPAPARGITCLLHAVVFVRDPAASRDFYTGVLGMRVSDRIEDVITFLRCGNLYHHSLALARGDGALDHIAMLVDGVEDVLAFRANAALRGALAGDIVKHVASNSVSVYLTHAEEGIGVEFCNGHDRIADDSYTGRLLKAGPGTVNAWSAGFPARPIPEPAGAPRADASAGGGTAAGEAAMAGSAARAGR